MASAEPSIWRIRVVTALIIVGVFASGAVVGAGIHRWGASAGASAGMPQGQGAALWLPLGELELTPEQDARISAIMDRHRGELEAIVRESFPRVRAVNEQMRNEVRALLSPEQRKRWDELQRRGPSGPARTWQKELDDAGGEPLGPRRAPARRLPPP